MCIEANIDTLDSRYHTDKVDVRHLWKQLSNMPHNAIFKYIFTRSTMSNLGARSTPVFSAIVRDYIASNRDKALSPLIWKYGVRLEVERPLYRV